MKHFPDEYVLGVPFILTSGLKGLYLHLFGICMLQRNRDAGRQTKLNERVYYSNMKRLLF